MSDLNTPIPLRPDWDTNAGSYKDVPYDKTHRLAHEPLVKAETFGLASESYYARTDGENTPYDGPIEGSLPDIWCRKSVAQKLVKANFLLAALEIEILLLDAYRPIACQAGLWAFFMAQAQRDMPKASDAKRREWVLTYVSDPSFFDSSNSCTWPAHSTGGAVDVTLREKTNGQVLDMGTHFDDMEPVSRTDYFESLLKKGAIQEDTHPALRHRRWLYNALSGVGFINYPLEVWHFDPEGTQMGICNRRAMGLNAPEKAWYGYSSPPSLG